MKKRVKSGSLLNKSNMKIALEINKKVVCPISEKFFSKIARKTVELSGYRFLCDKKLNFSLAVIGDAEMRKLNMAYRKKDCTTDVLSFPNYKLKELEKQKEKNLFLGEIIISFPYLKKSAKIRSMKIEDEVGYIFSHGVLHCLGFEHGKKMFGIQDEFVKK